MGKQQGAEGVPKAACVLCIGNGGGGAAGAVRWRSFTRSGGDGGDDWEFGSVLAHRLRQVYLQSSCFLAALSFDMRGVVGGCQLRRLDGEQAGRWWGLGREPYAATSV